MTEVERLHAENEELERRFAWRTASNEKLLDLIRDFVSESAAVRELAAGRAIAMLNALDLAKLEGSRG